MPRVKKVNCRFPGVLLSMALALSGCASWPDSLNPGAWFGDDTASKEVPGSDKDYPKLSSVPDRPPPPNEEARKQMAQGLIADRDAARYTDETLRRVEPVAAPPPRPAASATPQAASGSGGAPTRGGSSPPAVPRQPVRAEPVPASPPPQAAAPPPEPQIAAAPSVSSAPASRPAAPSMPAQRPQAPSAPVAPPSPSAAAPPTAPEIVAMAPIRSPGDPAPSGASPTQSSVPSNLVWGAPPSDIDLTRGSRVAAAAAAMPAAAGGPVASILFASGSARLGATDESRLRQVADMYRRGGGTVSVIGHASTSAGGRNDVRRQIANFSVSMDRANAVAQALQRYGVPSAAIAISAQADAVVANDADGRRADVFLLR